MGRKLFSFSIDAETEAKLQALADKNQRSKGGLLKWLITREYADLEKQRVEQTNKAQQALLDSQNFK